MTQIVILGASGDLTRRKLIPALATLEQQGRMRGVDVVGVSRRHKSDESFRAELAESVPSALRSSYEALAPRIHYVAADLDDAESVRTLAARLEQLRAGVPRIFYMALAPELFAPTVQRLASVGLVLRSPHPSRIVVEKPFGKDLETARRLNSALHEVVSEEQVYRIDHYLGKETVQNLLGFRFHNAIFEPLWNRHHVELVQITVAEEIGVENGRAGYYDGTGAMRDMLQNHMLQVLSLVAMEPPSSLNPESVRDQKVGVLRGLRVPDAADVRHNVVRARYAGTEKARAYIDEDGVPSSSTTETFVAVRAEIDTWRWTGVPFLLRHGKRMPKRFTEVQVQFRTAPLQLFNRPDDMSDGELRRKLKDGLLCVTRPNVLTLSIQPHERITLSFGVKQPGNAMIMTPAKLAFDYREHFGEPATGAYERLLLDALLGDPTLFLRADEIEASWRYADGLRDVWQETPLLEYSAGSWGPDEADELFHGCEGGWSRG